MNILVFSWRDPRHPLGGGAEQVMHQHMLGWIKQGWSVTLFSSKIENLPDTENLDGVKIMRGGHQYLGVQIEAFKYYLKNKDKFDLVIDQFHGLPFFTPLYVDKPIIAVLQEVARRVWFLNPLKFPLNYVVGAIGYVFDFVPYLFYKKTPFIVGSESAKTDLGKYGISLENITVVPHGVIGPSKKYIRGDNKEKTITFLGTLSEDKGIIDAIKTFKILSSLGKYKFWVIGKAETEGYFRKIKDVIKKYGIEKKVKLWGRVSDNEKFDLLSKSFVLLNPSVHEGWGLVNIEANLVGTPVVAYPSPGLIDSVKDGVSGIITKSKTPEDLAVEIDNLGRDKVIYVKMSRGAYKWASNFSWEKSSKISVELIRKVVSGNFFKK